MTITQTTTLIFQYPQDYMQEQEWCKTKDDRWVHIGTDTLGSIYENQISYAIGASVVVKDEKLKSETQNSNLTFERAEQTEQKIDECETCKHSRECDVTDCKGCCKQTEPKKADVYTWDGKVGEIELYEPTDCTWK